ncbi:uncharacterized protein LOC143837223 [Paroedura picta]|uniref:uncharacterized protein LOC143837223 n=1 Tax=Paroedura picta TaxID=143630 RepID=UPI004056B3C2
MPAELSPEDDMRDMPGSHHKPPNPEISIFCIKMTPLNQIVLLVICGSLCFTITDALQCRVCMSMSRGEPCRPPIPCSANPATHTCHALKTYLDGVLQQKILGCKPKASAKCGTVEGTAGIAVHSEHVCCKDSDFCNENI